jgi:methionyl-tRNA formyltransferase
LECDAGDVFFQKEIPIKHSDTGASILGRYLFHYPKLIKHFLQLFRDCKITGIKQNENLITCFGKRTPADGRINWDWQRERI